MKTAQTANPPGLWGTLQSAFASKSKAPASQAVAKVKRHEMAFILRNLTTLIENGVSLPRALQTLARERALKKHELLLTSLRRQLESGESFSAALEAHPEVFPSLMVNQIRVGERSGTLAETLTHITAQREDMNALRSLIIKKLAYPVLLVVMGTAVVTFMLMFVIPVFEQTYADANVPLPLVTQALIAVGRLTSSYAWIVLLAIAAGVLVIKNLRRRPEMAFAMDSWLLKLPLIGPWLRDLAVLQMMDVLGNLMESGFRLADALGVCGDSVGNRAIRKSVRSLEAAVQRGERFSREIDRHGDMFPPIVSQLVIVGEQTGNVPKATAHIRAHLRKEIERTTSVLVGTIEPVLTIFLAGTISVILLAIYLPMFDMIGAVTQ